MSEKSSSWQSVEWQPIIDGRKQDIPIDCLVGDNALLPGSDPAHLYPGYGEERMGIAAAIKFLNLLNRPTIAVQLPDSITRDSKTLEMVAVEAPRAVAQWFNETAGRPSSRPVDVLGNSKGAGVLLMAAAHDPEQYGAMGLIGPIGVTNKYLGETEGQRLRNYFWRIAVLNNLKPDHNPLTDPTNLLSFYEYAVRIAKDIKSGVLKTKLDLAFSLDLAETATILAQDHPLRLFLGEDDELFTTEDYRGSLGEDVYSANTEVIPGSHSSMITKMGRKQLRSASDWRETVRFGQAA